MPARPTKVRAVPPLQRGEAEHLEEDVGGRHAGGVEALRLGRADRDRGDVLGHPRQLDADRVVGDLADDARALEGLGDAVGERLRARGADQAGARLDHLARVRRPADAGDPLGAEGALERDRRRQPLRRHAAPLASETMPARSETPRPPQLARAPRASPFEGTARKIRSVRANWSSRAPRARTRRWPGSSTPGR